MTWQTTKVGPPARGLQATLVVGLVLALVPTKVRLALLLVALVLAPIKVLAVAVVGLLVGLEVIGALLVGLALLLAGALGKITGPRTGANTTQAPMTRSSPHSNVLPHLKPPSTPI